MKPITALSLFFALAGIALADDVAKTAIEFETKIIETDTTTGNADLLSAPRVTSRVGNLARVEVVRELKLGLPGSKVEDATHTVQTGLTVDVTGWLEGDQIVVRGTVSLRELGKLHDASEDPKLTPNGLWAEVRVDEIPFIFRLKSGEPTELECPSAAKSNRRLTIKLTATKYVPVNAAPLYWQAISSLPKLDDAERKLLDNRKGKPTDAERALVARAEPALKLLEEASRGDFCDWNLDLSKGPSLALPHLASLRELARLALLKARVSEAHTAVSQCESVFRLARHASKPPLLICRLVGISLESMAGGMSASQLTQWPEEVRNHLGSFLDSLPAAPSIADCAVEEAKMMSGWLEKELAAESARTGGKLDVRDWGKRLFELDGKISAENDGLYAKLVEQSGSTVEGMRKLIVGYREGGELLAKEATVPASIFAVESPKAEQRVNDAAKGNVLVATLTPSVMRARASELKGELQLALLKAALAVQRNGETALPAKLATFTRREVGFELTSLEKIDGKPVTLVVGPR